MIIGVNESFGRIKQIKGESSDNNHELLSMAPRIMIRDRVLPRQVQELKALESIADTESRLIQELVFVREYLKNLKPLHLNKRASSYETKRNQTSSSSLEVLDPRLDAELEAKSMSVRKLKARMTQRSYSITAMTRVNLEGKF
jgi:hypothetical protein